MDQVQEKINELNQELGALMPFEVAWVNPFDVELLEENARYMRNDMFAQLVANVKRDGGLGSVPLLYREPGREKPTAISGNHRMMAARAAKLPGCLALLIRGTRTPEELVAIQLSHNAIVGADDLPRLKALYEKISKLDLKAYSGLDEETLQKLESIKFSAVSEPKLTFKTVALLFMPSETDEIEAMVKHVEKELASQDSFLFQVRDYQEFFDLIVRFKSEAKIKNSAAAILELMRAGVRQLDVEAAALAAGTVDATA